MSTIDDDPFPTSTAPNTHEAAVEAALKAGEKQEGCPGSGVKKRCLRVFRQSDSAFTLKTINFETGEYQTAGITQGTTVRWAKAALKPGLKSVKIDGISFPIEDNQPPDNCD